jgi:hypothetical protein
MWYVDRTPGTDVQTEATYDNEQDAYDRDASYGSLHGNGCGCSNCDPSPRLDNETGDSRSFAATVQHISTRTY